MEDLIKKFFYTGVGIASLTAEKLQESVDELVGRGKVSEEEGKKIVDDFADKAETRKDDFESRLKEIVENVRKGDIFPKFMTKEDLETLVSRIEALESKIDGNAEEVKAEVKAVVKKTTSKAKKVVKKTES